MSKYSSGLVSESFWFLEVKKVIKLLNNGTNWDEIKTLALEENLFELSKISRAKRVYGYIKNRLSTLDENMLNMFGNADLQTQKIINLIAIANQNTLFYEFLYEIYREKGFYRENELTSADINIFFKNKAEQYEDVEKWTDVTLKRLRGAYLNFLTDAGLLTVNEKKYLITPPILDITLDRYLQDTNQNKIAQAIKGGY